MRLQFIKIKDLPPLSWVARVVGEEISVFHGTAVECFDNGFVEGAWNSSFSKHDFISADWFCGTGAVIKDNFIIFSTPTHVTYGLYSHKISGGGTALAIVSIC